MSGLWGSSIGAQGPAGPQGPAGAQGVQGPAGVSGLTARGVYNGATAYVVNDFVTYNGSSYVNILACTGVLPTNTTNWVLYVAQGPAGPTGSTGPAGVQGPAGSLSLSASYTNPNSGSVALTVNQKLNQAYTVYDTGAAGNGTTNDTTAINSPVTDVQVPSGTFYGPNGFTLAGVRYRGVGTSSLIQSGSSATQGLVIQANTVLDTVNINHPSATNCAVLGSAGGVVSHSKINAVVTSAYEQVGANPVGSHVRFSTVTAPTFGVLVNTQGQTSPTGSKASAIGNDISTVNGDAIEWNMPSVSGVSSFTGTIAALNFLANTATSGSASAGFAVGVASPLYNVVMGNVILASRLEQIHVEDSQRCTTIVGNAGTGLSYGVNISMGESQNSMPATITANAFENSNPSPTGTGISMFWYTPGSLNGTTISANTLHNYNQGIYVGGVATGSVNTLSSVSGNSMYKCNYGIAAHGNQNQGTVRQTGTNLLIGTNTNLFATEQHSVRFGKVITDQNSSTKVLITNLNAGSGGYNGELPSMIDGFEYPTLSVTATTGGVTQTLFTAGGPYHGRLKCQFKGVSPTTDWCHLSADINWDGTTFTSSNILSRVHGQVSTITLVHSGGNPQVTIVSTANTTLQAGWIEFDGEFWDA